MGRATEFFHYLNTDTTKPEFEARYFNLAWYGARKAKMWIIAKRDGTRKVCTCGHYLIKAETTTICPRCERIGCFIREGE